MIGKDLTEWLDLDYKPKLPKDLTRGIGIIGAGGIVKSCHLPAYRMAGFNVVGIYDLDTKKAQDLAAEFKIQHVFSSMEDLLNHPEIEVVDIAVPAKYQPDIVELAAKKGKHMLCQKPLGETYEDAKQIVDIINQAGVIGAVNQQLRWSPAMMASYNLVQRGWLGQLTQATIQVNVLTEWELWPWITKINQLEVMYHSIHYLDVIRFIVGHPPEYIYADGAKFPGQTSLGETRTLIHMKFPGEVRGLIHDNHNNISMQDDWYATFRFEGTDGIAKGTKGALYNYPVGREDTLQFMSNKLKPDYWFTPNLEGRWFPHAFMGTMGELLRAIEERREPVNSVNDNLETIKMVFASYLSMKENRAVWLEEFDN
jgi:predicted dehydrogenase